MSDQRSSLSYSGSVCISGLTAAGKTTHSHLLAGELGLTYVSASQIQLNFLGRSPIQPKDFWITEEARGLHTLEAFRRIDSELLRIESVSEGYVFDSRAMPWRHRHPALCIWLESSLESRVKKAIISHRGRGRFDTKEYEQLIESKDHAAVTLYKKLLGIDIASDLSRFDLVLDISSLIGDHSLDSSLRSISITHSLIRPAVAWYLTGRRDFKEQFEQSLTTCPPGIVLRNGVTPAESMAGK